MGPLPARTARTITTTATTVRTVITVDHHQHPQPVLRSRPVPVHHLVLLSLWAHALAGEVPTGVQRWRRRRAPPRPGTRSLRSCGGPGQVLRLAADVLGALATSYVDSVAAITAASGLLDAVRMYGTHTPTRPTRHPRLGRRARGSRVGGSGPRPAAAARQTDTCVEGAGGRGRTAPRGTTSRAVSQVGQASRRNSGWPSPVEMVRDRSPAGGSAVAPVTSALPSPVGPQVATAERMPASSTAQAVYDGAGGRS